jgi:hypothetical protein
MNASRQRVLLFRVWVLPLLALAGAFWLLTGVATAQGQQKPPPEDPPAEKVDFQVFRLRHVNALEISQVLGELFGTGGGRGPRGGPGGGFVSPRIAVANDDRTNSLIVKAAAADMAMIERLIRTLDVGGLDKARHAIKVFTLRHIEPDQSVEEALKAIIGPSSTARLAVDRRRKTVVLSADETTILTVQAVLERLEDAQREPEAVPGELQVRIVWLVSGLTREDAPKPPEDLKDVVAELAKLGIDKPRLAAQTVINTMPNTQFTTQGSAVLDTPCQVSFMGMVSGKKEAPALQIAIQATRETPQRTGGGGFQGGRVPGMSSAQICNLQTTITTPLGHAVVLGVTPTETMTSVFVVQVLRKEPKKAAAKP